MIDRWLLDLRVLGTEVISRLHGDRLLWRQVIDEIQNQAATAPRTFRDHYTRLYIDSQVMALRRVTRGTSGQVSLSGLVRDIARNPEHLTRDRYLAFHDKDILGEHLQEAAVLFDTLWGDGSGKVDPHKLETGVVSLFVSIKDILARADRLVAHIDRLNPPPPVTFRDLDEAIDRTGDAFQNVALLLTGSHYVLRPTIQEDWTAVFRFPLFR